MALLPARNILDGTALPVTSQMKTALGSLRDFCSDLLGTDSSNKAAARTALGAAASGPLAGSGITGAASSGANTDITSLTNLTGGALVKGVAPLGFGAGAGGTVTQATSKSTTVTINKPAGRITMNGAALAASTNVSFTVNNSLVSDSDTVLLSFDDASAAAVWPYKISVSVASGLFRLHVFNVSGGTVTDALIVNFTIVKGSAT